MKSHKVLLFLLLFTPLIFSSWHAYSGSGSAYGVERPWEDRPWRCGSNATGVIYCESKLVIVSDWPYSHSYSCNCGDDDGCDICRECLRLQYFTSAGRLGYSKGVWDVNAFEGALDSMELYCFSHSSPDCDFAMDGSATATILNSLNNAYNQRTAARTNAERCKNSGTYSAHNSLLTGLINFNQYRAIMAPGGSRAPYPCTASEPGSYAGTYCKGYPASWQSAVSYALYAISESFDYADEKIFTEAQPLWNRMQKSGICDDDYDWDIGNGCSDMESAFSIIDGEVREGTYGQYYTAKDYFSGLQEDVWNYPPEMENYTKAMKLLWHSGNGTIPMFSRLIEDGNEAVDNAEEVYSGFISEANTHKSGVNGRYSEMNSEKISMIHEAVAVEQISEESIGTIAERFSTFKSEKSDAEDSLSNATSMHGRTSEDGYLKKATRAAYDSRNTYSRLASSAGLLLDDAGTVVDQQRERASSVLNQAKTMVDRNPGDRTLSSLYSQAENLFNRGESASTLGEKYDYYARAESYAWQILEDQHIITEESEELFYQVEDLIRRAEIDEINVASEEATMELLQSEMESRDISPDLRSVIASILNKAELKYGHLEDVREELLANISRSGSCGSDLKAMMDGVESGIISGSAIDYMNGIGRLKTLESDYEELSGELAICENNIIANSLIVSQSLNIEKVKIDEEVNARLLVLISNPTYYSGEMVVLRIPLQAGMQLLYSDISEGEESVANVLVDGNTLVLTLSEVGPYWTRSVNFEKNAVFADTVNVDRTAEGLGDGKVKVGETRTFTLDADGVYLDLSPGEVLSAEIDGKSTDVMLDRGEHTLEISYVSDDAYETNKSEIDAAKVGLNTQVNYKISVIPSMDIDSLPLNIDIEYGNVSGISISSVTGASISSEECHPGYCEIVLSGLEEDGETLISVSYMILNTDEADVAVPSIPDSEYCIEGLDKKCDPMPSSIGQTVALINSATESGDYATAIELKEKLKNELEKWLSGQQSLADDYSSLLALLQSEKAEIESALETAGTSNGSLVDDMKKRESDIDNALDDAEKAETLSGAVDALESIGTGWKTETVKSFKDDSWEEYNSLKKRLFDAGVTAMPVEFMNVENSINSLDASGSLDDAVKLMLNLKAAEAVVVSAEADVLDESRQMELDFEDTKESYASVLDTYRSQKDAAEGTPWESLFTVDSSGIESAIDEIEDMFGKENNRLINKKMELLGNKMEKISGVISQLKDESEELLLGVRSAFEGRKAGLPSDMVSSIESGITAMEDFIAAQNYIAALKAGNVIIGKLEGGQAEDNLLLYIMIAGALIAIAAAAGVYYYKFKKGDGENGGGIRLPELPGLKTKKKEFKRLEKAEQ